MKPKTFAVCTLGCKVNAYESDCLAALFEKEGLTRLPFDERADIYLINTCSVTNTGDKKSRQAIHRARRQNPNAFVAVCGCFAQADPSAALLAGADLVAGTNDRAKLVERAMSGCRDMLVGDIAKVCDFEMLDGAPGTGRTRAYIKIQDGCNNFCSYCIIPYTRGRVRSRRAESAVAEAKRLLSLGYRELVLTGIEVYSYGTDLGDTSLLSLLQTLEREVSPPRIRLSSIDPRAFSDSFIEALASLPSLCHHFHISAQSGCNATLRRMNRPNTAEEFLDLLDKLRRVMPDVGVTTDIITGFPGETDEEFEQTRRFVKAAAFSRLHVFPYSERKGTKAASMEQLPKRLRAERARVLIEDGKRLEADFAAAQIGQSLSVLFERGKNGLYEGYSGNYVRVLTTSEDDLCGRVCRVIGKAMQPDGTLTAVIDK